MVAFSGKFQIKFLGSKTDNNEVTFAIENRQMRCKKEVKLLGITNDEKLTFAKYIANIWRLANNKLRALTIGRFRSTEQTKYLSETYIMSALKCNQINKIHTCTLRLIYQMEDANFEDLVLKDSSWNVHEN